MKIYLAIIILILGISASLYLGLWVMFIGGIVQLVGAVRAEQLIAMDVALGVARVCWAGFVTSLSAMITIVVAMLLLKD
ncbi:MAG: hypothetical protein HOG49_39660 [Candidatus Scalindua sp.]|jgi:hypothetical protein|nr:hypothetical protein [Candidatus Scalindua sp.]